MAESIEKAVNKLLWTFPFLLMLLLVILMHSYYTGMLNSYTYEDSRCKYDTIPKHPVEQCPISDTQLQCELKECLPYNALYT